MLRARQIYLRLHIYAVPQVNHRAARTRNDKIRSGEAHIGCRSFEMGITHKLDMHLKKNRTKGIAIDGIPIRKASSCSVS